MATKKTESEKKPIPKNNTNRTNLPKISFVDRVLDQAGNFLYELHKRLDPHKDQKNPGDT